MPTSKCWRAAYPALTFSYGFGSDDDLQVDDFRATNHQTADSCGRSADRKAPQSRRSASLSRRRGDADPALVTHIRALSAAARRSPDAHATDRRRSLSRSHPERAAEPLKNRRISSR